MNLDRENENAEGMAILEEIEMDPWREAATG
jgi:hypothetical protein